MFPRRDGLADLNIPPELLPLFLQAAMQQNGGAQSPFPDAPPSRQDQAYQQSLDRWGNIGRDVAANPADYVQTLGAPGFGASLVMRAKDSADRSGQRGQLPLGSPRKREDAAIPDAAQPTAGPEPAAPPADVLGKLLDQKTSLQAEIARATAERDAQAKIGGAKSRGPKWQAAVDTANGLISQMGDLDAQIKASQDERAGQAAERKKQAFASDPKTIEAENVRSEMLGNRRLPFHEKFPNASDVWSFVPGATAAGVHGGMELVKALKNRTAAGRWMDAIETATAKGGSAATKARMGDISAGYAKEFPKVDGLGAFKPYGVAAGAGALEGAALSNVPELYDSFAPGMNQERQAYEEYLKRLPADHPERGRIQDMIDKMPTSNPIKDAAIAHFLSPAFPTRAAEGALEGMTGATTGKALAGLAQPTLPRAEAAALAKELKRGTDAKKAIDAKKAAKTAAELPPPEQPPMITTDPQAALPPPSAVQPQQLLIPRMTAGDDTIPNDLFQQIMQRYMAKRPPPAY